MAFEMEWEFDRLMEFHEYKIPYLEAKAHFNALNELAAQIFQVPFSFTHVFDATNQWAIGAYGADPTLTPRITTICHHTITQHEAVEIKRLDLDERFADAPWVVQAPFFKHYYGVPLVNPKKRVLGTLCVIATEDQEFTEVQKRMLQLLAQECVKKLEALRERNALLKYVASTRYYNSAVLHDVRSPLYSLRQFAALESEEAKTMAESKNDAFALAVHGLASTLCERLDDYLGQSEEAKKFQNTAEVDPVDVVEIPDLLKEYYGPLVQAFGCSFEIDMAPGISPRKGFFPRSKVLEIIGNMLSYAVSVTEDKRVPVRVEMKYMSVEHQLFVELIFAGAPLDTAVVQNILSIRQQDELQGKESYSERFKLKYIAYAVRSVEGKMEIGEDHRTQHCRLAALLPLKDRKRSRVHMDHPETWPQFYLNS
ncbi:MAG: GAF domain-containing protein [Nitritalea sp.]